MLRINNSQVVIGTASPNGHEGGKLGHQIGKWKNKLFLILINYELYLFTTYVCNVITSMQALMTDCDIPNK